jgi:hypothetical protein
MATSQNGYIANRRDLTSTYRVPGTDVVFRLRTGPVAQVLVELASRFHLEVEPLTGPVPDDWSYAERPIRGSTTTLSNHASGTAIDLNALRHPRGVHGTFTAAQKAAVNRILDDLRDPATGRRVVRWGEDYSTVIDGMHFEIDDDPDAVARVATLIQQKDDDMTPEQLAAAVAAGIAAANSAASVPVTRSGKPTARSILTILSNLDHAGYGALPPADRVLLESAAEQVKVLAEQVKALTAATDQIRSRLGTPDQTE